MMKYTKDGGENYPVQQGEVWHVGEHQIRCGDLMNQEDCDWLSDFRPALVYTDPPWGQALATGFRTKAGLNDYVTYQYLFRVAFQLINLHYGSVPTYFEQGTKWAQEMQDIAVAEGLKFKNVWGITYYKKSPATLTLFNADSKSDMTGIDDNNTPAIAIMDHTSPGDLVVDLMTGRGLTSATAAELGRVFAGMELSPWRVSCALTKLNKITGLEPQRG
ncbi:hypothetical protein CMI37_12100 [Candidatus Pacearchaeota archaeon]|nr:hypothetical protein [Candidatus Pacearchaeota archaeon]|tara:strand:+ start:1783 stop:2436 length:654 start_codon:yes stop_codon:yes gene_type:complete